MIEVSPSPIDSTIRGSSVSNDSILSKTDVDSMTDYYYLSDRSHEALMQVKPAYRALGF